MIEARVLDIQPHPDQATHNPGYWAVRIEVSHEGRRRTFWRWHTVREDRRIEGSSASVYVRPSNDKRPTHGEILARFWDDTFADLHGFAFNKDAP